MHCSPCSKKGLGLCVFCFSLCKWVSVRMCAMQMQKKDNERHNIDTRCSYVHVYTGIHLSHAHLRIQTYLLHVHLGSVCSTHAHTHVCINAKHTGRNTKVYIFTVCMCWSTYTCMCVVCTLCLSIHTYVHTYYVCIYTYIHTYIHT